MSALSALVGGVFATDAGDDNAELRMLVDDIGRRSHDARLGQRELPDRFDDVLWQNLSDTGLDRLTSTSELDAGPTELAVVLRGLARHAGAVPLAETDLLAAWLCSRADLEVPAGPLTIALADAEPVDGRLTGTAADVPWLSTAAAVVLAARGPGGLHVAILEPADVGGRHHHNMAGEPRSTMSFDQSADDLITLDAATVEELVRRGAWARCVQIIGALDAAAELTVAHTTERVQFGRPLSRFQAVQHQLAQLAGEIERARAAATLAVAAAAEHGFDAAATDYAVTVAKVVLGRAVRAVSTIAHQLHGAIGVTIEHQLWLVTTRAQSWIDEFGSTGHYARRLGHVVMTADDPWDVLIGNGLGGWPK